MKTKAEKEEKQRMWGHGEHWVRGQRIGKGGFGSVFVAFSKKPKWGRRLPEVIAVKSAKQSKSESIRHEAEVLFEIQGCPFVIKRLGEETTTSHNGEMIDNLLLEYAPAGTLYGLIQRSNGRGLPESDVISYTRSILEGIKHIHMCGYVHCDLKPENILFVPNTATRDEFLPKIADFGLAKKFDDKCRIWRGTPEYQSPETHLDNMQYQPSDIWSLGCIVLEMLAGKSAWDLKSGCDVINDIYLDHLRTCKIPAHISDAAKDFLQCCLAMKSWERLTAQDS